MIKKVIILHLTVDVYLVSNTINSRDFSAPLGRFTAPVDQRPKVLDIARVSFCVFEKLKLNNKATRIKRNTLKLIAGASQVRQKPRLLLSHFLLVLAVVLNYSTICQEVVVKPYTEIVIHRNVTLLRANVFCSSVSQENVRSDGVCAQLYPV